MRGEMGESKCHLGTMPFSRAARGAFWYASWVGIAAYYRMCAGASVRAGMVGAHLAAKPTRRIGQPNWPARLHDLISFPTAPFQKYFYPAHYFSVCFLFCPRPNHAIPPQIGFINFVALPYFKASARSSSRADRQETDRQTD